MLASRALFAAEEPRAYLVVTPLEDVRAEPVAVSTEAAGKKPFDADPLQETQVVFGEEVIVHETSGTWARVEAAEQPEYSHKSLWEGYPGWVERGALYPKGVHYSSNAVVSVLYAPLYNEADKKSPSVLIPLGARVSVVSKKFPWAQVQRPGQSDGWMMLKDLKTFDVKPKDDAKLRQAILETARLFLDQPYYWGGRSSHRPGAERPTGVDCSGLVNLSYRVNGVDVPRDAHEQRMRARPLARKDLKPGDLIFLAKTDKPEKIVHVMIYEKDGRALEAVQEFNVVRSVTMKKKLGVDFDDIQPHVPAGDRFVYFGRLLPD